MKYKELSDFEIIDQIHCCNEDANEILMYKYKPLIVNMATKLIKYSSGGVDINDLIQEGYLSLSEAVNNFREDKDANFGTYAKLCIQNKMISYIRKTKTLKNKFLNESLSIDDENITLNLQDNNNPFDSIIEEENKNELLNYLEKELSDFEKQIFDLKCLGLDYKEIASFLLKEPKTIDNAIQRIKTKVKKFLQAVK